MVQWWLLRALFVNQQLLDVPVKNLKVEIEDLLKSISETIDSKDKNIQSKFFLESSIIYNFYGNDDLFSVSLEKTSNLLEFEYGLTGKLGKRTKFQTFDVSQLVLEISSGAKEALDDSQVSSVPNNLEHNDETLLEKIELKDSDSKNVTMKLGPIEQCVLLIYW